MATMFDMAIDHFWRAQQATMKSNQLDCLSQMANGLQLLSGALKEAIPTACLTWQLIISGGLNRQQ